MSELISDEQLTQAFANGPNGSEAKSAVSRFLSTTPDFYPSIPNIEKLFNGVVATKSPAEYTDVQSYRDVYDRLKQNNSLEYPPKPVEDKTPDTVGADGFTDEERERAKNRRESRAERAIWNMPADQYAEKIGLTGGKRAR